MTVTPARLFRLATAYSEAGITALTPAQDRLPFGEAPIRFLAWHAMELYLKAFILARNLPAPREHSIAALHEIAINAGLRLDDFSLLEATNDLHSESVLERYLETNWIAGAPTTPELLQRSLYLRAVVGNELKAQGLITDRDLGD